MTHLVSTIATKERYDPEEPDGWLDGIPYYLLNPRCEKWSLKIDYGLSFVKYDAERGLNMYVVKGGERCTSV